MKKTCASALLLLASCTSPEWRAYVIDEHVSVQLPEEPAPVDLKGVRFSSPATEETASSPSVRVLSATDNSCAYGIIINRQALPANLADLEPSFTPDSFYNQGIRNVLERNKSTLMARSSFSTPAGKGVEVKFSLAPTPTHGATTQYIRTVLVGRIAYTFTFEPRDDRQTSAAELRQRFFRSITVTP